MLIFRVESQKERVTAFRHRVREALCLPARSSGSTAEELCATLERNRVAP